MAEESEVELACNLNPLHGEDDANELFIADDREVGATVIADVEDSNDEAAPPFNGSFEAATRERKPVKGKKSPRRSDDEDAEQSTGKKKKPRNSLFGGGGDSGQSNQSSNDEDTNAQTEKKTETTSLFGNGRCTGPFVESDNEDDADNEGQSNVPTGIRGRMSSLTLDQQNEARENGEGPSRPMGMMSPLQESERSPSPTPSEQLDEEEFPMPTDDPVASYGLRTNIDRRKIKTTHLDADYSGDFDPAAEARKEAQKRSEAKARKAKAKGKGKGKKKAVAPQERIPKFIVRFKFKAFGNVLNVTNAEFNWPDGHSILDTEDEREQAERRARFRQTTPGLSAQEPIRDPRKDLYDLTGHPIARGCKSCRQQLQDCSAVETGEFPCTQCKDDEIPCQPIVGPKVKGRCGNCNEAGQEVCSFETGGIQGDFCDECFDADLPETCEPMLPPGGYKTSRIDIDRIMSGPDRKFTNCTNCRLLKKRCSLKRKTDKPPCKHCKKTKRPCTFYETPVAELSKKEGKKKVGESSSNSSKPHPGEQHQGLSDIAPDVAMPNATFFTAEDMDDLDDSTSPSTPTREATPDMEMEDIEGRRGKITKIRTCFAHPVVFHSDLSAPPAPQECSFCEMPALSLTGLFEKTVHVLAWPDGTGYTEIAGGHSESYDVPTTMCQVCTFSRLQVIACPGHDMQPLDDASVEEAHEHDTAFDALLGAVGRSEAVQRELAKWCAMCFSVARYRCCAGQPSLVDDEMRDGCGLRLCGRCEEEFGEVFEGDSSAMAAAYEKEGKSREEDEGDEVRRVRARADVGFLMQEGLLVANVNAGVGGDEGDEGWEGDGDGDGDGEGEGEGGVEFDEEMEFDGEM
ncbi:hypothetical protein CC80DRAFT_540981 [Byssothecium circinans]|uniref:Zn(2)-C6 fungal-type domain-containing protein n=1 Tax=Byssothecium circinans TaxID=147558 RepID=A0A6A5T8C8_9PLEO|nr:hypothetical protein CC80DRAFT_540981 [Byssothecium circinans]